MNKQIQKPDKIASIKRRKKFDLPPVWLGRSIPSRGPFTREKKTVIRGTWVASCAAKKGRFRRDFFLEKATREREEGWGGKRRKGGMPKGEELDRRERIEIYSSSFCLEALPAVHTPLTCPFPDTCSNPRLPSLSYPRVKFRRSSRRWKVKGLGRWRNRWRHLFSVLVVVCTSGNRIVLRDKIKKRGTRDEIFSTRTFVFSREHMLSMLKLRYLF